MVVMLGARAKFSSMKDNRPNRRTLALPLNAALALAGLALFPAIAMATPATELVTEEVTIPFEPPLGQSLTYRAQKIVEKDGVKQTLTTVETYRFEEDGNGYRLVVTPKSIADDDKSPIMKAIAEAMGDLMLRPYAFRVSEHGELGEMIDQDVYWNAMFDALAKTKYTARDGKPVDPKHRQVLDNYINSMRGMSAEARAALMAEGSQPVLTFAGTAIAIGSTVQNRVEVPSPFGGRIARDVTIKLDRVDGNVAYFKMTDTIPRSELEAAVKAMFSKLDKEMAAKLAPKIAEMAQFSSDTTSEYAVSLGDGLLDDYKSVETVVAVSEGKTNRRVTTKTLRRVH